MNYSQITKFIDVNEYDHIVSIGNKCPTAMYLKELNVYKDSFPFDYIPTTAGLILKYLKSQDEFYPKKNIVRTEDDVWFGHFNLDNDYDNTIETFKRRFERLFDMLQNKKKILFVYTSEADIYNEMNNRYNDNYNDLNKIVEYIIETYKYDNFKILCIHVNKTFTDTNNMIHYSINVEDKYFSDDMSSHNHVTCDLYRNALRRLLKDIFRV